MAHERLYLRPVATETIDLLEFFKYSGVNCVIFNDTSRLWCMPTGPFLRSRTLGFFFFLSLHGDTLELFGVDDDADNERQRNF